MTERRPPKKSDTLEVRMPHETKRAFIEACRKEGRTASEVVRDFVEGYLARGASAQQLLWRLRDPSKTARSLAMTLLTPKGRRGVLAAGVGALALIGLSVSPSVAEIDFRAMFDRLDADADGRVTLEEFAMPPEPQGDVMMFYSLQRTRTIENGDAIGETVEGQSFWLPAPPDAVTAEAPRAGLEQEIQIVRNVEGGELVTEEVEPLPHDVMAELRSREFAQFDGNQDGAVDYAEFEGRHRTMLENTFDRIDTDSDGALSPAELEVVPAILLMGVGAPDALPRPSPYDERAFGALDRDGDGGVSLDEFAAGPATP